MVMHGKETPYENLWWEKSRERVLEEDLDRCF